jgi:hypothetical protein
MVVGLAVAGTGGVAAADAAEQDWFRGQPVHPANDVGAGGAGGMPGNAGRDFGQPQVAPPFNGPGPQQNGYGRSDFPEDQIHDWVVASARAARSRAILHLSETQLNDSIRDAQWNFEQSHDFREAVVAEKQAYEAYTIRRQKALQSVFSDPKYRAAIQLCDEMSDRIAKLRAMSKPGPVPREDLLAAASQKLQYASDAHNMERDALEKDAAVQEARQKMVQANARVAEMRAAFDNSVRMNPQIAQARRNLDAARVELITAEAYYSAATAAGAVATDYSYYRHRWDGLTSPVVGGWGLGGFLPGY